MAHSPEFFLVLTDYTACILHFSLGSDDTPWYGPKCGFTLSPSQKIKDGSVRLSYLAACVWLFVCAVWEAASLGLMTPLLPGRDPG